MGEIRDRIDAVLADGTLTAQQRMRAMRRIRGEAMRDAMPNLPHSFNRGAWVITIESAQWRPQEQMLEIVVTVYNTTTQTYAELDNPFQFINPPTLVEDPTGDVIVETTSRDGTKTTRRFREAPLAALRQIIVDAVGPQVRRG